jgi:hypothetical protein
MLNTTGLGKCVYKITISKLQKRKYKLHNWSYVSQGLPPAELNTTHNCLIQIAWLASVKWERFIRTAVMSQSDGE